MNQPPSDPNRSKTYAQAAQLVDRIRQEIGKAVVAQDQAINQILAAFMASGHVLIEGVPGLGKTLSVLALSRTFGGNFGRIQFTPDLMPADVTGHSVYDAKSGEFKIRKGPAFTHLLLADEINRAPAKTQASLLEVMQERQISIEGTSFPVPSPFMTLATQNPIEQEGTYPLPEAQLDRFLLKVRIDYPSADDEVALVRRVTTDRVGDLLDVSRVQQVTTPEQVGTLQTLVARVVADDRISDYAVRIVRETRAWRGVRVGVGPRGAIALVRAAKAWALMSGRDFVLPDDIKVMSEATLLHRLGLAPELEIEGYRPERLLAEILERVEAPRE